MVCKNGTLAKPALEAYKKGELNFIPERFGKVYSHWLENIRIGVYLDNYGGDIDYQFTIVWIVTQ